jgi:hypothetical protein
MNPRPVDPWAAAAAVLTAVMIGVYVAVIRQQDGDVALWYLAVLVLGAVAAGYGAVRSVPRRRPALIVGTVLLGAAGVLGLLTIGLPILVAGALCGVAAMRSATARSAEA